MFEKKAVFNNQKILKILEVMTLAAVACLTMSKFGGYYLIITTVGKYSKLLEEIAFALFLSKIILTRYNKKEFLIILIGGILGYCNYKSSGNTEFLMSLAMVFSLKNVSLKKVFQVCFFSVLTMILLLGLLSVCDIAGKLEITKDYGRGGVETRYCFGFYHPNQWAHALFMLLLFGTLAFWEKMNWKTIIVIAGINIGVYQLAVSRTAMICGMVMTLMTALYKYGGPLMKNKKINYLVSFGCMLAWPVSVIIVFSKENQLINIIDRFITGRILMARIYLNVYSPSNWGEKIADQLDAGHVLDFGYIRFLLEKGIIIYVLMMIILMILCVYAVKKQRYEVLLSVICITLYGVFENVSISMAPANVVMIYLAMLFFEPYDGAQKALTCKEDVFVVK